MHDYGTKGLSKAGLQQKWKQGFGEYWGEDFDLFWSKTKAVWSMKVIPSCPTLCNTMDYTLQGILQARILEWVAFLFSRGSSQPRGQTQVSPIAGRFFTSWATREALHSKRVKFKLALEDESDFDRWKWVEKPTRYSDILKNWHCNIFGSFSLLIFFPWALVRHLAINLVELQWNRRVWLESWKALCEDKR